MTLFKSYLSNVIDFGLERLYVLFNKQYEEDKYMYLESIYNSRNSKIQHQFSAENNRNKQ